MCTWGVLPGGAERATRAHRCRTRPDRAYVTSSAPAPRAGDPAALRAAARLIPAVLWVVGMLLDYHPTLLSGFARMQSELNDTRLNNYFLEHSYRWLLRVPTDVRFWDPPAFFPAPNTAAYSEILLSVAPVYWMNRALGAAPDVAFQLWLLTMASLNYVASYLLLRRTLQADRAAAALGAFVFAFGAPRGAQVLHAQLVPQFFTLLVLYALWRAFDSARSRVTPRKTTTESPWIAAFFLGVVAQLYAGFYYAWFLGFALLVAALWSAAIPRYRAATLGLVRRQWWVIAGCAVLSAALVWPMAAHYLRAARDVGLRDMATVMPMLPRPASWMYMGGGSWLYGSLAQVPLFRAIPAEHEQRLGLGLVTTMLAISGLWVARHRTPARLMLLTAASLVVVTTLWTPRLSPWTLVFHAVPGAAALRAVSRIGMMLLIPASFGVTIVAQRLAARRWRALVPLLAAVVVAEQGQAMPWYDRADARARTAAVAAAIPSGCAAFLYTPIASGGDPWVYHGDAMWAALERGVPTVNGYSGNLPPAWSFYDAIARTPRQDSLLGAGLSAWRRRWRLDSASVCRVRLVDPEAALAARR